jgi:Flp pilus assembly protein TadG
MNNRRSNERGASMVEFALVLPLFLLLLFGIMEVGWLFAQQVEVRNAAREGARLAVVDFADTDTMRSEVCARASLSAPNASVQFQLIRTPGNTGPDPDAARVTVSQVYRSITGGFIPGFDGSTIRSVVDMRLEQDPGWTSEGSGSPCP